MSLIVASSLLRTLDNITAAFLSQTKLSGDDRIDAARWIAARVGKPGEHVHGSYAGLPAPTEADYRTPQKLFTGEVVRTQAGTGCKLGFEATWALAFLNVHDAAIRQALQQSQAITLERFSAESSRAKGMYCCYSCSAAGWRGLAHIDGGRGLLNAGVSLLKVDRDGTGRWRKFPFWYSVLGLLSAADPNSIGDVKPARAELRYAAPALERFLSRKSFTEPQNARRKLLAERSLALA